VAEKLFGRELKFNVKLAGNELSLFYKKLLGLSKKNKGGSHEKATCIVIRNLLRNLYPGEG
jgi:hypothetical protein